MVCDSKTSQSQHKKPCKCSTSWRQHGEHVSAHVWNLNQSKPFFIGDMYSCRPAAAVWVVAFDELLLHSGDFEASFRLVAAPKQSRDITPQWFQIQPVWWPQNKLAHNILQYFKIWYCNIIFQYNEIKISILYMHDILYMLDRPFVILFYNIFSCLSKIKRNICHKRLPFWKSWA